MNSLERERERERVRESEREKTFPTFKVDVDDIVGGSTSFPPDGLKMQAAILY